MYTPGPWQVKDTGGSAKIIVKEDGKIRTVATIIRTSAGEPEEKRDNARLIAAAPDMLSALHSIFNVATCAPNDDPELASQEFSKIMDLAQVAMQKALEG